MTLKHKSIKARMKREKKRKKEVITFIEFPEDA